MPRRDRNRAIAATLGHFPAARVDQPVDERADGVRRATASIAIAEMLREPYGFGTGSATTAGCPFSGGSIRCERDVVRLQRKRIARS